MTPTLRRLTDEDPSGLGARLIRAGRSRQPPPPLTMRTLGKLGLTAAAAAVTTQTAAAAASPVLTVVKWGGVGLLVGASTLATVETVRTVAQSAPVEATSSPTPLVVSAAPRRTAAAGPATTPVPNVPSAEPSDEVARGAARAAPELPAGPASGALVAELALLDQVRRALKRNAPSEALALLDQHERHFANPQLAEEAAYLRGRALRASGDEAAAQRAEEHFRYQYPNSTLPR